MDAIITFINPRQDISEYLAINVRPLDDRYIADNFYIINKGHVDMKRKWFGGIWPITAVIIDFINES